MDALESELNPEKMNNAKVANMPSTEGLPSLPQGEQTEQKEREEFATEERSDTKEPLALLSWMSVCSFKIKNKGNVNRFLPGFSLIEFV